MRKLEETIKGVRDTSYVKVGFMGGATYPDGTSVVDVATWNEFGVPPHQPPRPFFRLMVANDSPGWSRSVAALMKANGNDVHKVLGLMGVGIVGQLQQSIISTNDPPLAPSTIARKGSSKPLVASGHMLASPTFEVVDG